jgi:phosphoribosyl-AMP cyclohydrolase / phosphoribosyl-ATP pyrophosphohydrolase
MISFDPNNLAWEKMQGLLPVIVKDQNTGVILMLAYMNKEALEQTIESRLLTFFSRSRNKLWMKGETSGHKLELSAISTDCDKDSLVIHANPTGPICHTGNFSCFEDFNTETDWKFIKQLEDLIHEREQKRPENSYVTSLFNAGIDRMAQKVGEEALETALASINKSDEEVCSEAADLMFHLLVLLRARKLNISNVIDVLKSRS